MIEQSETQIPSHCRLYQIVQCLNVIAVSPFFPVLALGSKANSELPSLDVLPPPPPNHSNLNGKGGGGGGSAKSTPPPPPGAKRLLWRQGKTAPSFILS